VIWTGPLTDESWLFDVRPELTDEDVAWLNEHARLAGLPREFARKLPPPPPPPDYED
jgi:hypothetical protein